jgi:AcrR family transcriptional regulator
MQNAILGNGGTDAGTDAGTGRGSGDGSGPDDVAQRIARQTLARRAPDYSTEVRRLLDAALDVMRRCGTTSRPRVADIVAAAGLSNDAFYRHFASKDILVAALLEDGTERLRTYLAHQMAKQERPERKVRCWVEGILSQAADDDIASTTLAVLWNAGSIGQGVTSAPPSASAPLAGLVREPFEQLGSTVPELDASLAAHAVVGTLSDHLWQRTRPTGAETDQIVAFCLAVAGRPRAGRTETDTEEPRP